jgi:ferrous iron transport protein B
LRLTPTIALIGNPNTGKSTLFNALTGLNQRVGNYPGVTVERHAGTALLDGRRVTVLDLPGTYSLAAHAPDELIAVDVLLGRVEGERPVDLVVAILDAATLERNLYLLSQLTELPISIVVALNMVDVAEAARLKIDVAALERRLGLPVVPIRADRRWGIDALGRAIHSALDHPNGDGRPRPRFEEAMEREVRDLRAYLEAKCGRPVGLTEAFRTLVDRGGAAERRFEGLIRDGFSERLEGARRAATGGPAPAAVEAMTRYAWIRERLDGCVQRPAEPVRTASDRIDAVLTHRLWGTLVLLAVLVVVFQSIYRWALPLMDGIDAGFAALAGAVGPWIPEGAGRSFVVDGLIGGVGAVIIFLPQILILFLFISILEDCGYMARAAFLMDKLFAKVGLSGRSMIPLMSSFACAIPGIMAARTIAHPRQRLATILISPLMSCSARLPVYVILIGAFVPATTVAGGWVGLQGLVLLGMHLVGALTAIGVMAVLRRTILRGAPAPFMLELPPYQWPQPRTVAMRLWTRARSFLTRAGTIILVVTTVVWALLYFPRPEAIHRAYELRRAAEPSRAAELEREEAGAYVRQSYLARMGRAIEPVFGPLGWDWKIGMGALASFPAREVIVSTLGTIYNLGGAGDPESPDLAGALRAERRADGTPAYSIAVALSVMVFFALCAQCGATLAVIKRETNSWLWPAATFAYMTGLAYVAATGVFQVARAIGL